MAIALWKMIGSLDVQLTEREEKTLSIFVNIINVKLLLCLDSGHSLHRLCRSNSFNYNYCNAQLKRFEELKLVELSFVGREIDIELTDLGREIVEHIVEVFKCLR